MKAIETRYAGRRFRSRTEARYAVLFDALKLDWDYEPEGFEIGAGRYLPDFFIRFPKDSSQAKRWPGAGYWIEIKGGEPTAAELEKLAQVSRYTEHKAYLFAGQPNKASGWASARDGDLAPTRGVETAACFLLCSPLPGRDFHHAFHDALYKAMSARFEFGETGA